MYLWWRLDVFLFYMGEQGSMGMGGETDTLISVLSEDFWTSFVSIA